MLGQFLVVGLLLAWNARLVLTDESSVDVISDRCSGTLGTWCEKFINQTPIPWKSPPKHNKACLNDCNGVGQCNYMTGICLCPAGSTGADCSERELRPCTDRFRKSINDPVTSSYGLKGTEVLPSRCAGVCDEDRGHCYCAGKYGRVNAENAPPGSPPIVRGRQIPRTVWHLRACGPREDEEANRSFGDYPYDFFYGPEGFCDAEFPPTPITEICRSTCLDDLGGPNCDQPKLPYCVNQCNGHGDCNLGFCKCHEGYYGHDCAILKANSAPREQILTPPEKMFAKANSAMDPPPEKTRKSPLIYIYDLPTMYNSRMLQYKPVAVDCRECCHRRFDDFNNPKECSYIFAAETALHELMAQSDHRTFDPEEADYFYMPIYASCYVLNVFGYADFPWFYGVAGLKSAHHAQMILQAKQYVEQNFPYWNATGGANHIFLYTHDEGSCYAPAEIRVVPEISNSSWQYLLNLSCPCVDTVKDLVIPPLRPMSYFNSPMLGSPTTKTKLLFFRGDIRLHNWKYSRGVRQEIYSLAKAGNWREKYNIFIGTGGDPPGDYSQLLASSIFCAVLPGDGYSSRATDAITNGCIPLVIQDNIQSEFETVLDWEKFAVRIHESEIAHIPEILMAFSPEEIERLQKNLAKIWHRFTYTSLPLVNKLAKDRAFVQGHNHDKNLTRSFPHARSDVNFDQDDAFETIIGFLHHRIPYTRGHASKSDDTRVTTLQYLDFDDDTNDHSNENPTRLSHLNTSPFLYHSKNDSRVIGRRKRLKQPLNNSL